MTIQRQLTRLVTATVLPAGIAAALLIGYSYERERTISEQRTLETARSLMQAVDRQLAGGHAALRVLAGSEQLLSGDLAAFYRQARDVIGDMPGDQFALADGSGQMILNTARPYGAPLPKPQASAIAQVRRVFDTGMPVVSDLIDGAVSGRKIVSVAVPVFRDGRVVYYLSMRFTPERLREVLVRQNLPPGWVVSIFDRQGTIVARTHDQDKYVGQTGSRELVRRMMQVKEGRIETDTLEGIPVVAVFSRSAVSDWSVAIGIPRAALAEYLWTPFAWIVAGILVLLGLGIMLARKIGARIAEAIRGLLGPARALVRAEPVILPPLGLVEADEVGRELVRAASILHERERVLALVCHDLRSPLTGLMLRARAAAQLATELPGGGALHAQIAALADISRRMSGMVDDLLSIASSTGGGRSMLRIAPTNAASLLAKAVELARPLFEQKGVALEYDASELLPDVRVDPDRILRVFTNLLDNALKFTQRQGRVELRAESRPEGVQFSVANSGPALSAQERERMFEPFWQARDADSRGAGLGMSICRSIIEAHGGTIEALPEPGKRVRICVWLPVANPAETAVPDSDAACAASHGNPRVGTVGRLNGVEASGG
jgi:signal transduction histidine kinase